MEALSPADIIALRRELAAAVARAAEAQADAANARAINSDLEARIALQALQIAMLKRDRFGQLSERSHRLIDQLELRSKPPRRPPARTRLRQHAPPPRRRPSPLSCARGHRVSHCRRTCRGHAS